MTFTTQKLVGSRVLVKGADSSGTEGQTILDSTQWDEINSHTAFDKATEAFEAAVESFFAPLTEATEAINKALNKPNDPLSYVVLHEAVEGTAPQAEQLIKLSHDSIVLRLIEQGDHDRLVWVGDELEVLEVDDELPFEADAAGFSDTEVTDS